MKKPEILAPAGDLLALRAAILAGCDAVYLGGHIFGARAFSTNFSDDELKQAVDLTHANGVRIYVTVNTLIYEDEVETFMEYIKFLYEINVDAVIVQDIGMMDLIHQTYPNLEIHVSTQMHIHNLEGAKLVSDLGATRVVLARETPIDLVKAIKEITNMDIEIFVHGALCICYSGQCLMSSLIGGRSGNRGTCAGSCRLKYDVLNENFEKINQDAYNLSTKDLNTLEHIDKLIEAGVDSFKIEGRMKSPSYVYLVTSLYREAVDSYYETGKINIDLNKLKQLKATFNREYTKGFLFNESNNNIINPYRPNHLGIEIGKVINVDNKKITIKLSDTLSINDGIRFLGKTEDTGLIVTKIKLNDKNVTIANKDDVIDIYTDKKVLKNSKVLKTTDSVLNKEINTLIERERRTISVKGKIYIRPNEKMIFEINDGFITSRIESERIVSKAVSCPTTKEQVKKQIYKTGATVFDFTELDIDYNEDAFIPVSELNEIRRRTIDNLLDLRVDTYKKEKIVKEYKREVKEYPLENITSVYVQDKTTLTKALKMKFDTYYIDESVYTDENKVIKKIPRVMEFLKNYDEPLLVGELGSVYKYKDIITDFSLNVVNSYSAALLNSLGVKRITLSYEMNDKQIKELIEAYKNRYKKDPNLAIIIYGREEMMVSKFNLLKYYNLKDKAYLRDKFNNLYPIKEKNSLMYIYNCKPRNLTTNYFEMGINEVRYNIFDEKELDDIKR